MPFGQHAADGSMTTPPDTADMDEWLDNWKGARYYCVDVGSRFSNELPRVPGSDRPTPAARKRIADWITFWVEHLRTKGIRESQVCLLHRDGIAGSQTGLSSGFGRRGWACGQCGG